MFLTRYFSPTARERVARMLAEERLEAAARVCRAHGLKVRDDPAALAALEALYQRGRFREISGAI